MRRLRPRLGEAELRPETEPPRVSPALMAQFDRYDQDKDNVLDRVEFTHLEAQRAPRGPPRDERHPLRPRREFPRPYE